MERKDRFVVGLFFQLTVAVLALLSGANLLDRETLAQVPTPATANPNILPQPMNWTAEQDHQNMMDQLGIKALRPGPSGNENAPNHANYDEAKANPFPNLPAP